MFKKNLSATLLAILSLTPFASLAMGIDVVIDGKIVTFVDVSNSAWFTEYVKEAAEAGIVSGYKDIYGQPTGKFQPQNNITIAEALKIISEGAKYDESAYASVIPSGVNHWSSAYVSVSKSEEFPVVTRGMNMDRTATRAEVAALITAAFDVETNVDITNRFSDVNTLTKYGTSIEALNHDEVVSGDTNDNGEPKGTFRPTDAINRAEVTKIIMRARVVYGTPGEGKMPQQ